MGYKEQRIKVEAKIREDDRTGLQTREGSEAERSQNKHGGWRSTGDQGQGKEQKGVLRWIFAKIL